MEKTISQGGTPTSSINNGGDDLCPLCDKSPICGGLGLVRYDVPIEHPNFGKMYRCPNNPPEADTSWQDKLRKISNLDSFADKSFENFHTELSMHTQAEQ